MTVLESSPDRAHVLAFIDESVRALTEAGLTPHAIVVGKDAYVHLRKAVGERFGRGAGHFETYQHLPVVVDPFRAGEVTVVPAPREVAEGVRAERI